jgi:hypothetical protein
MKLKRIIRNRDVDIDYDGQYKPRHRRSPGPPGRLAVRADAMPHFGISEGCLHAWLKKADVEDGNRPGLTDADRAELRELKKRNRLLEQENEVLCRAAAYLSQANLPGK